MKTDDLIRVLAADVTPETGAGRYVALCLPPALIAATALVWVSLGFRGDLAQTMESPFQALRMALALGLGVAGTGMVVALARPAGVAGGFRWIAAVTVAAAVLLWGLVLIATPAAEVGAALVGKTLAVCLVAIPLLSVVPAVCLFRAVKAGATTRPGLAGAGVGLASGGFAAAIYSLHCTEENPLFYVTWYGFDIAVVTLICGLAGQRILRW